ncbi:hypothetical protein [Palleronia marisminoris]|nr:hypothetical protein [Palleronia marisminoris]
MWRSRLFLYCLAADAVFIAIYVTLRLAELAGVGKMHSMLNLESESSLPSFFIYFQWLAMSIVLFRAARRSGSIAAAALGLFAGLLFLDDAAQIHEQLGELVASALDLTGISGVPPDGVGELIVLAGLGVVCLACIVVAWMRPGGVGRPMIMTFTLLAALLAGVGVGFDVVHEMTSDRLQWVFGTVEDGGEMILATAMLALAARVAARSKAGIE